jgi:hypothetical protein
MTTPKEQAAQPEALRLAGALDHSVSPWTGERIMFAEAAAELRRLHAENEALRASQQAERAVPAGWRELLRELEWSAGGYNSEDDGESMCPFCKWWQSDGHASECRLSAMLAAAPEQPAAQTTLAQDGRDYPPLPNDVTRIHGGRLIPRARVVELLRAYVDADRAARARLEGASNEPSR